MRLNTLAGTSMCSSSHRVRSNSSAFSLGLKMKAMSQFSGTCSSRQRHRVVLPVPTSPVSSTKPPSMRRP
ncbi:hypothetical protein D3C84_1159040 [compost metagenome]